MQLINTLFIIVTVAILGCGPRLTDQSAAFFSANEHRFQSKAGVMYMDNAIFNGNQVLFYSDHDTAAIIPYKNGREEGTAVYRYSGGTIKENT